LNKAGRVICWVVAGWTTSVSTPIGDEAKAGSLPSTDVPCPDVYKLWRQSPLTPKAFALGSNARGVQACGAVFLAKSRGAAINAALIGCRRAAVKVGIPPKRCKIIEAK
jgi:hypothetical protein